MILFKRYHVDMILSGSKTETRRFGMKRWNKGSLHEARTTLFGHSFATLRILDVFRQKLGDMTVLDANAEGYNSLQDYEHVFRSINGLWGDGLEVWVIRFKVEEVK